MTLSKALIAFLLLATVTVATAAGLSDSSHGSNDSPVITSTNLPEIIVNPGENFSVICEGHTPVTWRYPNTKDNVQIILGTQESGKYVSSIQLINITYINVGYYYCLLDNNNNKNSSVYLYVNDTENLFVYDELAFSPIYGLQYEDVIIPCKPTHPEVNVTLCRNGDEKLHVGDNDDLGIIRYDQKVGFILENVQVLHNGYYFCCALPGDICSYECPRTYSLDVLKHANSVERPVIDTAHLQHVKVGDNVTIECRVSVPRSTKCDLDWIIPNESDRITIEHVVLDLSVSPGIHLQTIRRNLRIINAKLEDRGNYTCKLQDYARNTNNETIYLNIFSE